MSLHTKIINSEKNELRKKVKERIATLSTFEKRVQQNAIIAKVKAFIVQKSLQSIALYWSFGHEVATQALVEYLLQSQRTVMLPVCTKKGLLFEKIAAADQLIQGKYGIMEPNKICSSFIPKMIDAMIVPAVAVDRCGNRLGQGKGYYDRFFADSFVPLTLVLAYQEQLVAVVPVEAHDKKIDVIILPHEVIVVNKN